MTPVKTHASNRDWKQFEFLAVVHSDRGGVTDGTHHVQAYW